MPLRPTLAAPTRSYIRAARALVDAFADEPFDPSMPRCPHCVSDLDLAGLAGPVVTVDPEILARFVLKAGTTWGAPSDLRRLTPRVLLLSADRILAVDRAVVWEKLAWAGWPTWVPTQHLAVARFLLAEWDRLVQSAPRPGGAAHRWLAATASTGGDLRPYLERWGEAIGPLAEPTGQANAVLHLVNLLVLSDLRPDHPRTVDDLFGVSAPADPPAGAVALTHWLASATTAHGLERAAQAFVGTVDARRVDLAMERLRRFRAATTRASLAPA